MYIKSENGQAQQSQQLMIDALLILMKSYPFEDITITQICQEAKVVRPTFYRNFESKEDILRLFLDKIKPDLVPVQRDPETDVSVILNGYFDYMLSYKGFLLLIDKNNLFYLIKENFELIIASFSFVDEIMSQAQEAEYEIFFLDFIASTICSIISLWTKHQFRESTDTLAKLAKTFLFGITKQ
jgi:AcrR family transcriptional regulator